MILPCGHTICKSHQTLRKNNTLTNIKCPKCEIEHDIPENGFPINSLVEELLKNGLDKLDLGWEHNLAVESLQELKKSVEKLEKIRENPELEINRVISDLKNKIDLRREQEKKRIDDEALDLIKKLDNYETKCKAVVSSEKVTMPNDIKVLMKSLANDVVSWYKELNSYIRNENRWRAIHVETVVKLRQLKSESDRIEKILFTDEFFDLQQKQKKFCSKNQDILLYILLKLISFKINSDYNLPS